MSLASQLVHIVSIERRTSGAGVTKTWSVIASNVPVMIQPLDPSPAENSGSSWGKDFKGFFRIAEDIREGDRVVEADGTTYGVKGVRKRNYGSTANQHTEVLLGKDGVKE